MPLIAVFTVVSIALLASAIITPQITHAGGGVGGGGGAGGGAGGAHTRYGYGWYAFNTDGSGSGTPGGMRNGGSWANVQATCRDARATRIIAFIVQTPRRTVQTAVVYNYTNKFGGSIYKGNSGGSWEPTGTAQAQFNSLPLYGVNTAGYTFGGPNGNVAWFCYDYQPPQDYFLTPTVATDRTAGEADQQTTISTYVNNTGHVASSNTQWQSSTFVVPSGGSYPGGGNSPAAPAQYYGNGLTRLDGGGGASFQTGNRAFNTYTQILPDAPIGSRVCYALSVQARAYNDGQWAHSPPVCVVIAKKPKFQVHGGDIRVGSHFVDQAVAGSSNITTSQTTKNR